MNHEHSQKDKDCEIKRLGEPKGHLGVGNPKVLLFCINIGEIEGINIGELEGIRGLFPR